MIETLTLRNFKVLREVEVKLRPLTLIVGPNASGKSTILEALAQERTSSGLVIKRVGHGLPWSQDGLSSIPLGLYRENPERFREIVDRLKQVVPLVRDVRLERAQVEEGIVGYELIFDTTSAESVPAHSVSLGTLITLGLLTVLSSPEPPQLVLIDDLERGLHPKALGELIHQFRLLQEQNPELQIVATSHSPYLLDYVKAEEVLLTSLDQDGYAVVKSLTEHPEYERWKDLMAPGEFWSTVGESWVTDKSQTVSPVTTEGSLDSIYDLLEARFESGEPDVAARHDQHQP